MLRGAVFNPFIMIAILTEKPSVAEAIARIVGADRKRHGYFEGDDYCVTWALGHLISLALPPVYGFPRLTSDDLPLLPDPFKLVIRQESTSKGPTTDPAAVRQLQIIDDVFSRSRSIIVATDAGREGELIFRWIYSYLGYTKPFRRLWISSLTDDAIREGMAHLREGCDFDALYEAAECRAKADWLVGINASQALAHASGLGNNSLGRVQTPALAMICARYRENRGFTPALYWQLALTLRDGDALRQFRCTERIGRQHAAEKRYRQIASCGSVQITAVEHHKSYQAPPLLYDLTELQKTCNVHLDLSAEQTLAAAQSLYEKRLISYPRTGSRYIPEDVMATIPELLERILRQEAFGKIRECVTPNRLSRRSVDAAKVTDHHALLPTGQPPCDNLTDAERQVYEQIVLRTLEAFAPRCEKEVSFAEASVDGLLFRSRILRITQPGWRAICNRQEDREEGETEQTPAAEFPLGATVAIDGLNLGKSHTVPKPLYTEATLLAAMETAGGETAGGTRRKASQTTGLGTPATRASIISTLLDREYIERSGKSLIPTERGLYLYDAVRDLQIADAALTQSWEKALAQIERRERSADSFMQSIAIFTRQVTEEVAGLKFAPEVSALTCPKCHEGRMILRRRIVRCSNPRCGLVVFREVAGRALTDTQVEQLFTTGKTEVIRGFRNKAGRRFDATLAFDEQYRIKFGSPTSSDK